MKVTYNWLKDFVDINITPGALADKLTMAGLEVVSLEERGADAVFEIEITSNRPDWLSVIGIAREVAAITGKKLKPVKGQRSLLRQGFGGQARVKGKSKTGAFHPIAISIESKKDCPLYTATIIKGIKVAASPQWLAHRLELLGCRSINNIVDITNYVLFEYGQPLHAFDLDKLMLKLGGSQVPESKIIVRRAKKGEEITTIDGLKRELNAGDLVIAFGADAATSWPVAVAGVMGGFDTEVTAATKNILLEAAVFDPVLIRRSRRQLGLMSESAYRFERGVDQGFVKASAERVAALIRKVSGGDCVLEKSSGTAAVKKKSVSLDVTAAARLMGESVSAAEAKKILGRLGFILKAKAKNKFEVTAPSWRADINLAVDLVEEIARISGYNSIKSTLPHYLPDSESVRATRSYLAVKNALVALGLDEVITYSLVDKKILECFGMLSSGLLEVDDPLSKEQEVLRPSLVPSLCRSLGYNLNQKQDFVFIFEIGKVFLGGSDGDAPLETTALGIAACGEKAVLLENGMAIEKCGLLHIKGALEALFNRLGVAEYDFVAQGPGEATVYVAGVDCGSIAALPKEALDFLDIKNREVFTAEVLLDKILAKAAGQKKLKPLALYPGIKRDISFVSDQNLPAKKILEAVKESGRPLLESVRIVDHYKGKQILPGERSLTISCFYRTPERTLLESEVTTLHQRICAVLVERFGVKLR